MNTRNSLLIYGLILCCTFVASAQTGKTVVESTVLDKVWAGHPVGFDLLTTDQYQYAAYYNADRDMIVARRKLGTNIWQKTKLPTAVGWDSHNYVTLAIDREGYLHVSGNMHVVPLIYFRSTRPWEIDSFEKLAMTGEQEDRVTYPVFFKDQQGTLYFQYRNGGSGDGITYWNRYDEKTKSGSPFRHLYFRWRERSQRLYDQSGTGSRWLLLYRMDVAPNARC